MKKINIFLIFLICSLISCTSHVNKDSNSITDTTTPAIDEIKYFGSDGDLYRINISTDSNILPVSDSEYVLGTLDITEQDQSKVLLNTCGMRIRVRGNSTKDPEKKPYKIKFNKAQSLFGLKKAKDWVLLANYFDKTNIRNYLAFRLANKLDNLCFQPSGIFVDVYINNDYRGLYMLTEQIEANNGRVDIENITNSEGITSFLLEVDGRVTHEYSGYEDQCYFKCGNYFIKLKYPDCDDYIDALNLNDTTYIKEYNKNYSWVQNYFDSALNALYQSDYNSINSYIDVGSFIDYYIVQELFKNVDAGGLSQYYIIDQRDKTPKIKCGPVWDFDISAGVVGTSKDNEYDFYINSELYVREIDQFYRLLFNNSTFVSEVRKRYTEIRLLIIEMLDEFEGIKNSIAKAQNRNLMRWPLPKERTNWIEIYAMSNTYFEIDNLPIHYRHLADTLRERLKLLDRYYLLY